MVALAAVILLSSPTATEGADLPSQCVSCHTDAAKLKALTPPDPPATEEGEG
jgi:mono/diheme cytochrome c family protein